jgi:chromatin remodeling complex protein RSC6
MAQRITKATKKVEKKIDNKSEIMNEELVEEGVSSPVIVETSTGEVVESEVVVGEDGKKKRVLLTRDMILSSFDEITNLIDAEITSLRDSQTKTKGVKFLRSLGKKIKTLKNHSARIIKQRNTNNKKVSNNSNSGFLKPVQISKEMAKFTGWDATLLKSRVDVTKFLCNYIKENDLQNPKDRRQILADSKLSKLLKYDSKKETEPLTYFRIQSCLKDHFIKPQTV